MMFRDAITPTRVADLLILSPRNPRSLVACMEQIVELLTKVRNASSGRTEHEARSMLAQLKDMEIDEVFGQGLHEYLLTFLAGVNQLALDISHHFLVPIAAPEPAASV